MPATTLTKAVIKTRLNKSSPTSKVVRLGDVLDDLITNFNALLVKLDANHAAATDHSSTLAVKALDKRQ